MTCGLCHRDPDQHSLSTSGPTRCQYQTHRPHCPGNFSTKCSDHTVDGQVAPPEQENEDKVDIKYTEDKPDGLKTPATPATDHAQDQNVLLDIGKMVREHVSNNQQHLNTQTPSQGSYSGPNMAQIRQDPNVQSQADLIMNTLKAALPVFGQNQAVGPTTSLPGISALSNTIQQFVQQNPPQPVQPQISHPQYLQPQCGPSQFAPHHLAPPQLAPPQLAPPQLAPPQFTQSQFNQTPGAQIRDPQPQISPQYCPQQIGHQQSLIQSLQQLMGPVIPAPVQQPGTPQIPADLISALAQLGPNAAPLLQALQQTTPLTRNIQQVQQPQWTTPQPGLLHSYLGQPGHYQNLLGPQLQRQDLQQNALIGNLLGQPSYLHQQQALGQSTPQHKVAHAPAQGNTSMTGVMHVRPTEFSKYCSVEYAKKAKPENCNLVLFVWGFVAQILAAKQGQISAMSEQEQIGRLQHLLHVMELCAMQSSSTDFNSPAWLCARNYSDRVYQDLDSGATAWHQIGPKMHPTNMMQAMSTHPKVIPIKQERAKVPGGISTQQEGTPGQVCPKWSTCEVEEKCQWEVDNPGRRCNRSHHCSFCFKKFKQTRKHKETDCRKKSELSGSNGDQPTS